MNIAANQSTKHENTLAWAIICSILLHALLVALIPNIKFDEVKKPDVLTVELVTKPEPAPPSAQPEPIQPQPEVVKPQPEPQPKPKPVVKPAPAPVIEKTEPIVEQPTQIAPPPDVIAVAPKTESAPPTLTVPAPAPIKQEPPPPQPAPSQPDINAARAQYGDALFNAISKHKKYPKIAQMRGWEGDVVVELLLDSSGKIKSKRIAQPSGHEVLDKAALEMVEKASPFPIPPEILRNGDITITVPVPFHFE